MSLRNHLKNTLPPSAFYFLRGAVQRKDLFLNAFYDSSRFARWSPLGGKPKTATQIGATITMDYHRVEKGLSLPEPRPGFGKDVVRRLAYNIPRYAKMPDINLLPLHASYGALKRWLALAENADGTDEVAKQEVKAALVFLEKELKEDSNIGGTISIKKDDILQKTQIPFKDFFESRYSIRNFKDEKVEIKFIEDAIAIARKTPSVCNRQSWRVHAFLEPESCENILSCQNGNRGFGHAVPSVLLITTELQNFLSVGERYQGWIDGGMFSMSLALALHSRGLGTCCLNWSVSSGADRKLRKHINLPDSELVIMMMAVGHMKDEIEVATSPRIAVDDILLSVN